MNRAIWPNRFWRRSGLVALTISSIFSGGSLASADSGVSPLASTAVLGYRGSSQHSGQYAVAGPQSLKVDWYVAGVDDVNAPVAIRADGTIYTVSTDGVLRALSSSGTELWTSQLGTRSYGSPVLTREGDLVLVGDQKGAFEHGTQPTEPGCGSPRTTVRYLGRSQSERTISFGFLPTTAG